MVSDVRYKTFIFELVKKKRKKLGLMSTCLFVHVFLPPLNVFIFSSLSFYSCQLLLLLCIAEILVSLRVLHTVR